MKIKLLIVVIVITALIFNTGFYISTITSNEKDFSYVSDDNSKLADRILSSRIAISEEDLNRAYEVSKEFEKEQSTFGDGSKFQYTEDLEEVPGEGMHQYYTKSLDITNVVGIIQSVLTNQQTKNAVPSLLSTIQAEAEKSEYTKGLDLMPVYAELTHESSNWTIMGWNLCVPDMPYYYGRQIGFVDRANSKYTQDDGYTGDVAMGINLKYYGYIIPQQLAKLNPDDTTINAYLNELTSVYAYNNSYTESKFHDNSSGRNCLNVKEILKAKWNVTDVELVELFKTMFVNNVQMTGKSTADNDVLKNTFKNICAKWNCTDSIPISKFRDVLDTKPLGDYATKVGDWDWVNGKYQYLDFYTDAMGMLQGVISYDIKTTGIISGTLVATVCCVGVKALDKSLQAAGLKYSELNCKQRAMANTLYVTFFAGCGVKLTKIEDIKENTSYKDVMNAALATGNTAYSAHKATTGSSKEQNQYIHAAGLILKSEAEQINDLQDVLGGIVGNKGTAYTYAFAKLSNIVTE